MSNLFLGIGVAIYAFWYGFSWSAVILLIVTLASLLVYSIVVNQEQMLYQTQIPGLPSKLEDSAYPAGYRNPGDYGLTAWDTVKLKTADGETLHSIFINAHRLVGDKYIPVYSSNCKPTDDDSDSDSDVPEIVTAGARKLGARSSSTDIKSAKVPTILYLHENAGTVNLRLPNLFLLAAGLEANIHIIDYRGYGHSTGKPSEAGLLLDARAALAHLRTRPDVDSSRIYVFGRSLGGAVTMASAVEDVPGTHPPLRGVIVENTFLSISKLVDKIFPLLKWVKPFFLRLEWVSEEKAAKIDVPALFISGGNDELVPSFHMEQLYQLTGSSFKAKLFVDAGGHNTTWIQGKGVYLNYIRQYLRVTDGLEYHDDNETTAALALTSASVISTDKKMEIVDKPSDREAALEDGLIKALETTMGMKIE